LSSIINTSPALTFDDVLIQPDYSEIITRELISTEQNFLGLKLRIPIISANMDYVTGADMAIAMHRAGGLGILNRFMPWGEQLTDIQRIRDSGSAVAFSVGIRDSNDSFQKVLTVDHLADNIIVCIDVAHGEHKQVIDLIVKLKKEVPWVRIIAGNVATYWGFQRLASAGADAIKIGIGPGSVCTTREVTGVGVPQLTAIMEAHDCKKRLGLKAKIIADGGIKNSGDIVKALAAGADVVMLGSLLAGTSECPGEALQSPTGRVYKPYRGQSIFGVNGMRKTPEGISGYVEHKGPVEDVLETLVGGLKSGMSYVGAINLDELRENTKFIVVSHNTKTESGTRIQKEVI
jgi:IMP dehydrogenase